jgi:hypothetical protein
MTEAENRKLIRRLQKDEDMEKAARVDRLIRGLRKHGSKLFKHEITAIETAMHPAIGRVSLD